MDQFRPELWPQTIWPKLSTGLDPLNHLLIAAKKKWLTE
jgi:hypothetical protein